LRQKQNEAITNVLSERREKAIPIASVVLGVGLPAVWGTKVTCALPFDDYGRHACVWGWRPLMRDKLNIMHKHTLILR
jgi:hypothetical protein